MSGLNKYNPPMDTKHFLETEISLFFQPNLSNSPLNNDIKNQLSDKIKQMHCCECINRGYNVCLPLNTLDFFKVSTSENVLLLSAIGDSYEEIKLNLDIETSLSPKSYPYIILNFIVNNQVENSNTILKIYRLFQNYDTITGLCIDKKSINKYKIDIIAYK